MDIKYEEVYENHFWFNLNRNDYLLLTKFCKDNFKESYLAEVEPKELEVNYYVLRSAIYFKKKSDFNYFMIVFGEAFTFQHGNTFFWSKNMIDTNVGMHLQPKGYGSIKFVK